MDHICQSRRNAAATLPLNGKAGAAYALSFMEGLRVGIFSKIKDAIFGKEAKAKEAPAETKTGNAWADAPVTQPRATPVVDVENNLDNMPGAERLNWRTSIVDLMKLLGIDSSYENRKALAQELGREDYSGSAEDNVWLHRRTMQELSANGGRVPPEFTD